MAATLLEEINKESEGYFDNFRLNSMRYLQDSNTCQIYFHYRLKEGQEYRKVEDYARLFLPPNIKYAFSYARVTDHPAAVVLHVRSYFDRELKIELDESDVCVKDDSVEVSLRSMSYHHCSDIRVDEAVAASLDSEFCRPFRVTFREVYEEQDAAVIAQSLYENILAEAPQEDGVRERRVIEPTHVEKYIGDIIDEPARYIVDAHADSETRVTFCGKIEHAHMRELQSKKNPEKTVRIFRFTLTDFTGSINCFTFVSEANVSKYNELDTETAVLVQGTVDNGYQNNGLEMKINRISYCELPEEFVEVVHKNSAPASYTTLFPCEYVVTEQQNMFEAANDSVNPFFLGKQFVVFDTETTGVNQISDRIVEIACVKMIDGKIVSCMHTMVNPGMPIPESASRVNHITDDMVADAPVWDDVVGDIYKFCEGCTLVGHNVAFDINMLNNTAKQTHYYFEQSTMDTLRIAQQKVRGARNYTLGNLLKMFGLINENAHRALEDTVATAQLFVKLMDL